MPCSHSVQNTNAKDQNCDSKIVAEESADSVKSLPGQDKCKDQLEETESNSKDKEGKENMEYWLHGLSPPFTEATEIVAKV